MRSATALSGRTFSSRCSSYCSTIVLRQFHSVRHASLYARAVTCSATPTTYKQLVGERPGSTFKSTARIIDVPVPAAAAKEVLVRVDYAGINGGHDTFQARGDFAFSRAKEQNNFPLGAEGCGTVVEVGSDVKELQVGDAVAINQTYCFAEYVLVPTRSLRKVSRSCPEVVALTLSGMVACVALEATAEIKSGEVVLVTAAAGGTGHVAVQIAKLAGCHVVATCGSEEKAQVLKELGVDRVVNYKQQDLAEVLGQEYPNGVDVVYECVGGELLQAALDHLAPGGRLLQVGYISQYPHTGTAPGTLPALSFQGTPLPSVESFFWGKQIIELEGGRKLYGMIWPKDVRAIMRSRQRVFDLWQAGHLKVLTDQSHALLGIEAIPEAVEYMLRGGHVGKVVLKMH